LTTERPPVRTPTRSGGSAQIRVWHLALLVLFVAIAIKNIQDQGRRESVLIALAVSGFLFYGVIVWLAWRVARRWEKRLGPTALLILFLVGMAGLFMASTVIYLGIEYLYLVRRR
jgi:Kef-type K+ transport system membrane component KefB